MRKPFAEAVVKHVDPTSSVFLTGDLGFMALEPVREKLQSRFINAGVAEQNMVSVAAGLAHTGLSTWVYSIASFCYTRPFEQIRNDVCLHKLPVHLVGNGGGYGYGVMGATHHALEDYGVLLTLSGIRAYVPAFDCDVEPIVERIQQDFVHPTYLRLGRCERPPALPELPYCPWRRLLSGPGPVIVVVGPVVGGLLNACLGIDECARPEIWVVTELPVDPETVPIEFVRALEGTASLWVVEEHVAQGSFGHMLLAWALKESLRIRGFRHFHAAGYPSRRFGSQAFHRRESGMDASAILQALLTLEPAVSRS